MGSLVQLLGVPENAPGKLGRLEVDCPVFKLQRWGGIAGRVAKFDGAEERSE